MQRIAVAVVGAGQAGLATSHQLAAVGVDHVVLERGQVAQRWRSYQWESLRLLTPNWLSRLPGWRYAGADPDGYMRGVQVGDYLAAYAAESAAPVVRGAQVRSLRTEAAGYRLATDAGDWHAAEVVLATGWCDRPAVPAVAERVHPSIAQLTPGTYRSPRALPEGGVLVVGASASGVQIADEVAAAGRPVVLAVGSHTRQPRRYRGRDIMWWLDAMGVLHRRAEDHPDLDTARGEPSLQLAGRPDHRDVDLPALAARGVSVVGRLAAVEGRVARFADDLDATTADADRRLHRVLDQIDAYAAAHRFDTHMDQPPRPRPLPPQPAVTEIDVVAHGIRSVVWATGYRRDYDWLHVPVLDAAGDISHDGGSTRSPGLHVVGMRWQTRRDSSFIDGVRHDATTIARRIADRLGARLPVAC